MFIIGLGNLGEKYHYTRHNVAWLVLDEWVSDEWNYNKYMNAEVYDAGHALYIKPHTFMNRSGDIFSFLKTQPGFSLTNVVVIHDDIDLPFGTIRISYDRGDGGHNGLKSINQALESREYLRIRIGVALHNKETGELYKPNVLGNFGEDEREVVQKDITPRVRDIIAMLAEHGKEKTMNVFNTKQ